MFILLSISVFPSYLRRINGITFAGGGCAIHLKLAHAAWIGSFKGAADRTVHIKLDRGGGVSVCPYNKISFVGRENNE